MTQYEKLAALRKERGLSQINVAERLEVSRQSISRWESGKVQPSSENIRELAELYGVPTDYLLCEEKPLPEEAVPEELAEEQRRWSIRRARRVLLAALAAVLIAALTAFTWWYYEEGRWPEVHTKKIDMGEVTETFEMTI